MEGLQVPALDPVSTELDVRLGKLESTLAGLADADHAPPPDFAKFLDSQFSAILGAVGGLHERLDKRRATVQDRVTCLE